MNIMNIIMNISVDCTVSAIRVTDQIELCLVVYVLNVPLHLRFWSPSIRKRVAFPRALSLLFA